MSRSATERINRQREFLNLIKDNPFMTDKQLADHFNVSIPTIRHDRIRLKIPQLRDRVRDVATDSLDELKSLRKWEFVGELMELQSNILARSCMTAHSEMLFEQSKVVRGQFIYSLAESLAIAVIDAKVALVGVANIKYKKPVLNGDRMIANAKVFRKKGNTYTVWVSICVSDTEVFRGKFLLVTINSEE